MGYGGAKQRGQSIESSGDGSVDVVIDQEALGPEHVTYRANATSR
ncbi:hypothetical protein [Kocuria cellulosilytica]